MDQPASEPPEANPETLQALADQVMNHQSSIENYVLNTSIDFWLLRRLGLDPFSLPGRLVAGVFHFLTVLVPALILTAFTRDASGAALVSWIIVAVGWGGMFGVVPVMYRHVIPNHLSWARVIVDEGDLHRLLAWCRRWYNCRIVVPVASALTLSTFVPFYLLAVRSSGAPVPAGTLYVGAWLVYVVMQAAYAWFMMSPEAYNLTTYDYELYRLSPADSVAVRRSMLGYNQLGAANVLAATAVTLFLLVLLPAEPGLIWPVVLFLLLIVYLSAGVGVMLPLVVLGRIIRRTKEAEMETLQAQLDELLPRVRELSEEEYEEMTRLQKAHDTIRDSPENLLPLGAILRTVGALFLSTVTILVTAFAQEWIAEWTKRFIP